MSIAAIETATANPEYLVLIVKIVMVLTMAYKIASSRELALIFEAQVAVAARGNDRCVEVDQMRVVIGIALRAANAMRVMTSIAGRILAANVLVMLSEALVIQDAVAAVAAIAECII